MLILTAVGLSELQANLGDAGPIAMLARVDGVHSDWQVTKGSC